MKPTWLICLTIVCIALLWGTGYAGAGAEQQRSADPVSKAHNWRGSKPGVAARSGRLVIPLPNTRRVPMFGVNSRVYPTHVAPATSRQAESARKLLPESLPMSAPSGSQLGVRHGGFNPAIIRGVPAAKGGNTAALNGTQIQRKH